MLLFTLCVLKEAYSDVNFLCFSFVVSQILSGESRESIVENIHSKLIEVGQKVKDGEIPVELYQITKVGTWYASKLY